MPGKAITYTRDRRLRQKHAELVQAPTTRAGIAEAREAEKARRMILGMTPEPEKKRVKALSQMAPPDAAEAADLVARFLAERGATVCPARAVAAVNNGDGVG